MYEVVCFIDDDREIQAGAVNGIPVLSLDSAYGRFPEAKVAFGIGAPKTRQWAVEKAEGVGFGFETIIHPSVQYSDTVHFGAGVAVCAGSILTTNIAVGQHVQINLSCTIGHNVLIDEYATLSPGVHVSGFVRIGKRVFIGTGAVIINGTDERPLTIGDDVVIAAGACVTRSIGPALLVGGVPAKVLKKV
jgi:sugar O-acyltransferase (sialic acid O-acetyltransferase NeuD family)